MKFTKEQMAQIVREEVAATLEAYRKPKAKMSRPLGDHYTAQELMDYKDLKPREENPFTTEDGVKYFHGVYRGKPLKFKGYVFGDDVFYKLVDVSDELDEGWKHEMHSDEEEIHMVMNQLNSIAITAMELKEIIGAMNYVPEWGDSKIAVVLDKLESIRSYLIGKQ